MKRFFLSACAVVAAVMSAVPILAQDQKPPANEQTGVTVNNPAAFQGYSLVAPMNSTSTYLVDMEGRIVNEWKSEYTPALSAYLLPNGHLLRPANSGGSRGPGAGGKIQEFDWEGNLVWDYTFRSGDLKPHHDICPLPNGNVLIVCTDPKTKREAVAAGRRPELVQDQLLADAIVEVKPRGRTGGRIVWKWHAWDHLVQDIDKDKPGYGDVSEHPELIDVNFTTGMMDRMMQDPEQLAKLRSLGYVGGGDKSNDAKDKKEADNQQDDRRPEQGRDDRRGRGRGRGGPGGMSGDWMHVNAVAYNEKLDQIMISVHEFSEVWIIDHSTSTKEAASHSGGQSGKGGDLLYRWGNPKAYRSGTNVDQRLFAQHCAHWIADGLPGAGNMLVFNNGANRPDGTYSSADEIVLPVNQSGVYQKEEYLAFAPEGPTWRYGSPENTEFFSMLISGCQRLPNGNTFICSGNQATLFEVTPEGEVVWRYQHPGGGFGRGPGGGPSGRPGFGGPPGSDMTGLLPGPLAQMLRVDAQQQEKIDALQKTVDEKLSTILNEEQRKVLAEPPRGFGFPGGGFEPPRPGEVIPRSLLAELKLNSEQTKQVQALQLSVNKQLNAILTDQQKQQIADAERSFRGGPPAGFGQDRRGQQGRDDGPDLFGGLDDRRARGGRGGPGGRGPGGPGGGPGGGGPGGGGPGGIFRCYRYAADYAGLQGKELTPGKKLDEVAAEGGYDQRPRRNQDGRRPGGRNDR